MLFSAISLWLVPLLFVARLHGGHGASKKLKFEVTDHESYVQLNQDGDDSTLSYSKPLDISMDKVFSTQGTESSAKLQYVVKDDGSYAFHASGDSEKFYLASAGAFLQSDGQMFVTKDGSLKLKTTKSITGSDATGTYSGKLFQYMAGGIQMNAEVAVYNDGEFVRFTQSYPSGVKNCNVSDQSGLLSGFPSFQVGNISATNSLGFLELFGDMCGYQFSVSDMATHSEMIRSGERSGPFVLFDKSGRVMILSSYKSFMAHNSLFDSDANVMNFGIMGGVTEIPERYQIETLLYFSDLGINRAIEQWGRVLLTRYGKKRSYMESDFSIKYLGYYTDNGAFYYYNTEVNKTYETTMADVVKYAQSSNIPYGYLQYDSWWYYKGIGGGVLNWTSRPDVFPDGIDSTFRSYGLPVVAHNRYWASNTNYAKSNGGAYDFVVEEQKAIPTDTRFWKDLLTSSKEWGLITYEQDWLDVEFLNMKITHTNISVAYNWLKEMGEGASASDLTIQYCMALPRHMMQSVEIQAVTQARVTTDYHPGNSQWKLGVTSMFAHALYIAPFKDTFWTTATQSGNPYGKDANEPNTALQAAISTLSTGPVGPSDAVGQTNVDLLMKCCRADGLIIKPSRAITSTDQSLMERAFPEEARDGNEIDPEVYSTYSDLPLFTSAGMGAIRFGIVLAAGVQSSDYHVSTKDMYLTDVNPTNTKYVAYQGHPTNDSKLYSITSNNLLPITSCGLSDFQLWHVSPVLKTSASTEIVILGERSKWVPVSSQRIQSVEIKNGNLLVGVVGKPSEMVTLEFLINEKMSTVACTIPDSGAVTFSAESGHCIPN